jgi:hypothetical protein
MRNTHSFLVLPGQKHIVHMHPNLGYISRRWPDTLPMFSHEGSPGVRLMRRCSLADKGLLAVTDKLYAENGPVLL